MKKGLWIMDNGFFLQKMFNVQCPMSIFFVPLHPENENKTIFYKNERKLQVAEGLCRFRLDS